MGAEGALLGGKAEGRDHLLDVLPEVRQRVEVAAHCGPEDAGTARGGETPSFTELDGKGTAPSGGGSKGVRDRREQVFRSLAEELEGEVHAFRFHPAHRRAELAANTLLERGESVPHRAVELDGDEGPHPAHGAACSRAARSLAASALTSRIASTIRSRPTAALAGLVEGST